MAASRFGGGTEKQGEANPYSSTKGEGSGVLVLGQRLEVGSASEKSNYRSMAEGVRNKRLKGRLETQVSERGEAE